ncbi:MAG: ClbS/DfsB family four-helix bundle protein [Clostridium sp.]|nr:ClbS/DfsB family four-helix bundle protein [Clostridium sp.]
MDYKQKLIENIYYINAEEKNFITNFTKKEDNFLACYDNWSFKDVISHISEWRILSCKKLEAVKSNKYTSFCENLGVLNRKFYEEHKTQSIDKIKLLSKDSYNKLKNNIDLFSNSELISKNKLSGFKGQLWKYILIDSFMHPTIHMVFHYIKLQEFQMAFKLLEHNYILLLEIDNSEAIINDFFYLGEIYEELDEMQNKDSILFNLKEFHKQNIDNEIISNVVLKHFFTVNNI